MDPVVYRLRQLPQDADRLLVTQLLSRALDIDSSAIRVWSVARSTDPWVLSKIATLQFDEIVAIHEVLKRNAKGNITKSEHEWKVQIENFRDPFVLDSHFRGLTPLYDPADHVADCIAISGLSSHPFGSWQPKGPSKTFMWIRDALPRSLPKVRPILYGYDTTLVNSNSFQDIPDLAQALLNQMRANEWGSTTSKPLVFLAHSLGGIVLKQALVLLASQRRRDDLLQKAIRGAIFFGVPNFGMEQSHLMAMVDGQPNEAIVADLSVDSDYLRLLDEQVTGIAHLQNVQFYWVYETRKSPTVIKNAQGVWKRTGPEEILVTQHSATRGLHQVHSRLDDIFSINENHSNMVKFAETDPDYNIVVDKLVHILAQTKAASSGQSESESLAEQNDTLDSDTKVSVILRSLDAPTRDYRLQQIEDKFCNTFDWVYDPQKLDFSQWLQTGAGIFWINGKPGSGKSTLMKFIVKDLRTKDLLSNWTTSTIQIRAAFFFHYRGNAMQKSFEGLLRSVLTQVVKQCDGLTPYLMQSFGRKSVRNDYWTLPSLQRGLFQILEQNEGPLHLCLFLDALDEYDGNLESICKFLSDIGRIPQTATKRIQVCFSSRPWPIFTGEFGKCPGFSVQDYTKDDIRDFCLGSIQNEHLSDRVLESLVPDLVERSKGVFLWVKLVVKELAQASRAITDKQDLERRMRALPTELDQYYAELIGRIPPADRWLTYAMLEIVVRSFEPLTPRDFVYAMTSAESTSYPDCIEAYEKLRQPRKLFMPKKTRFSNLARHYSSKYCGGLLEVMTKSNHGSELIEGIQVFHQTVEDFVRSSKFKPLVLGDRAKITFENGNSFLAKLYFEEWFTFKERVSSHDWTKPLREKPSKGSKSFVRYAQAAEETTGRTMKNFLGSVPAKYLRGSKAKSLLACALQANLRLLVFEILAEDPEAVRQSTDPLITCVVNSIGLPGMDTEEAFGSHEMEDMILFLLGAGFRLAQDHDAFCNLIQRQSIRMQNYCLLRCMRVLLEHGQSPDTDIQRYMGGFWKVRCKALHVSGESVAELLLEYGADVNALDSMGQTPLTCAIRGTTKSRDSHRGFFDWLRMFKRRRKFNCNVLVDRVGILVSKGAFTRNLPATEIELRLWYSRIWGFRFSAAYGAWLLALHTPGNWPGPHP